jgi:hypothetical protein
MKNRMTNSTCVKFLKRFHIATVKSTHVFYILICKMTFCALVLLSVFWEWYKINKEYFFLWKDNLLWRLQIRGYCLKNNSNQRDTWHGILEDHDLQNNGMWTLQIRPWPTAGVTFLKNIAAGKTEAWVWGIVVLNISQSLSSIFLHETKNI